MTVEELLKPRYKVIADYPNNHDWKVGDILDRDWARYPDDDETKTAIWRISQYPHLFKKLDWWEDRKESDMPDYVKQFNTGIVEKVKSYTGCCSIVEFFDNTEGHISFWHPATEEEYLNQNKTTL